MPRGLPRALHQGDRLRPQPAAGRRPRSASSSTGPPIEPGFRLERQEKADRAGSLHAERPTPPTDARGRPVRDLAWRTEAWSGDRARSSSPSRTGAGRRPTSLSESNVQAVLDELDRELVALDPVKTRIREIAALLSSTGCGRGRPGLRPPVAPHVLHGQPGHGQDDGRDENGQDPARPRLHREGPRRRRCTRDDLVGQYVGHTAPKTKEVLRRAYGGVLFIDEAYYLYRPENERDYGQEAIEILLQVMEAERDKLVVIFAGYKDRMDEFFRLEPRHVVPGRAPPRLPGLRRRRAAGDRPPDARPAELRASDEAEDVVPGLPRAPRGAAPVSRTAAACATRSTGRGCARRTGSSTPAGR